LQQLLIPVAVPLTLLNCAVLCRAVPASVRLCLLQSAQNANVTAA